MWLLSALAAVGMVALPQQAPSADPAVMRQGAAVWQANCASCHDHPSGRIPPRVAITVTKSTDFILRTLNEGVMQRQAASLSADDRVAVATYLIGKPLGAGAAINLAANRCTTPPPPLVLDRSSWNGWDGGGGANVRYHPTPGISPAQVGRLKLKWTFAYPGGASSQPTIVRGRVFAPTMSGVVFALNAATGCTYWAAEMGAPVRSAISVATLPSGKSALFVGDMHGEVHALDADTGAQLWRTRIETHPMTRLTGPVTVHGGRVYAPVSSFEERATSDPAYVCCTFRGSLVALDAASGKILWKTYTIDEAARPLPDGHRMGPAGGAVWSAPTIDAKRKLVYITTGNGYTDPAAPTTNSILALDLETGAKRWVKQMTPGDAYVDGCIGARGPNCPSGELGPDFDFGSSALLVTAANGTQRLVLTSKSGMVFGLDPDAQGRVVWQTAAGSGGLMGGAEWGGASDGDKVYVSITDIGGRPRETGKAPAPGLNAISVADGRMAWRAAAPKPACTWGTPCSAAYHSAPMVIPGVVFAGGFDGHVRAYSTRDGRLVWDFDTGRGFAAVNGGRANGGSIDQGGQTVSDGRLFVSSGGRNGYPGNALLAFTVDGR